MQVTVLFFSVLRELVGADQLTVELAVAEGAPSLDFLLTTLYATYPALKSWDSRLLLAVNAEFATRETLLQAGDEVALMPPVQGG